MSDYSLGIDIGGTFTDVVLHNHATGAYGIAKESTTHDDLARGVLTAVQEVLRASGVTPNQVRRTVHATTLFTNALIERKGAPTGLITTQGFRDTLEIGRERKYDLYDIFLQMPRPLVSRNLRLEVPERIGPTGEVEVPIDEAMLLEAAGELIAEGVTSVAIVFLHSYLNPVHENAAARMIAKAYPMLAVTTSYDVSPQIGEYERASTTVANAYIKPLAEFYLDALVERLQAAGIASPFFLMLSNGGLTSVAEAKRLPIQLLESGPAAGALAGAHFSSHTGSDHVLAFDMGGTTAKASIIDHGEPVITHTFEAAREKRFSEGSGLPLQLSTVELIEIGAGGGSIARQDELGLLKVGPDSAGSQPGPACYGRGGSSPTVTDADLLLGYLNRDFFLGGAMEVDYAAADGSVRPLAEATDVSSVEAAWGIHDIVNENMASAARVHIADRGQDPRRYTLLATGGAGPVHAYYVARKLGVRELVVPPSAGVGSAIGLLMAPVRIDSALTVAKRIDSLDWGVLEGQYYNLEVNARRNIEETQAGGSEPVSRRFADMRYSGQGFELVVGLPSGSYTAASEDSFIEAFERAYLQTFSRTAHGVPIEIVNIRVSMHSHIERGGVQRKADLKRSETPVLKGSRPVYFPEERTFVETSVYDRYALTVNQQFYGPAIVEERESTVVLGPGSTFHHDGDGNLIVQLPA